MTYLNPLPGALQAATAQQQATAAADGPRRVRRAHTLARDTAAGADRLEHQVENTETVAPVHDEDARRQQSGGREPRQPSDEPDPNPEGSDASDGHIDLKA